MKLQFENLNDMKKFAKYLENVLLKLGITEEANKVSAYSYNSFTTSSEYLGEFRIVLNDFNKSDISVNNEIRFEIESAINAINKALGNTI